MSDLTSSVITPLRTSLNRLNLGSTTSKNSVSYFLRNSDAENCVAAVSPEMNTQCNRPV